MKPNVLFILIDDMGWKDVCCNGSTFYETPNIDRLAKEGVKFTDAYAACPVCSPTRASILTGKYPANVGVTDWIGAHAEGKLIDAPYIDHLPLEEYNLAKNMQDNGYVTWHVGKWHLGEEKKYYPENQGFDVNIGGCGWGHPNNGYFSPYNIETLENGQEGEFLTDRLTEEAINLINKKNDKPFFLNLWYYAVHTPIQAKEEYIKYFEEKAKKLGLDKQKTFEEGEFFPTNAKKHLRVQRRLIQSNPVYAALIKSLDENIGRVLKALEDKGILDNTIIIFTSDNGGLSTAETSPTCNFPLNEGKGWMYEGGVRVPLIVRYPKYIKPDSICTEPVTSPDFYPTILDMCNLALTPEQHEDGKSFFPLLKGDNSFKRGPIFWHYPHYGNQGGTPGSSIRWDDYKLIEFFEDNSVELYDLRNDIEEKHDISKDNPKIVKKLRKELVNWREEVNAILPKVNPNYTFIQRN